MTIFKTMPPSIPDEANDEAPAWSRRDLLALLAASTALSALPLSALAEDGDDDDDDDDDDEGDDRDDDRETLPGSVSAPATNIDLTRWKLTLPVNDAGSLRGGGDATEVENLVGFALPPYFQVTANSVTFMAPVNGVRTSGSSYTRCELREMNGNGGLRNWTVSEGGRLNASLRVNELPRTSDGKPGRIIVGQIHGPDDELCRLYYDDGLVYFIDDKAGAQREEGIYMLTSPGGQQTAIPLGSPFSYSIDVSGGRLTVSVKHGGRTYSAVDEISSFWPGKALYFKAGVYVQVKSGSGNGSVTFTALSVRH